MTSNNQPNAQSAADFDQFQGIQNAKAIAPGVFLVWSPDSLQEAISDFLGGTVIHQEPVGMPSSYPCVTFLYLKYHGGDDYVVIQAVPVNSIIDAIKDI